MEVSCSWLHSSPSWNASCNSGFRYSLASLEFHWMVLYGVSYTAVICFLEHLLPYSSPLMSSQSWGRPATLAPSGFSSLLAFCEPIWGSVLSETCGNDGIFVFSFFCDRKHQFGHLWKSVSRRLGPLCPLQCPVVVTLSKVCNCSTDCKSCWCVPVPCLCHDASRLCQRLFPHRHHSPTLSVHVFYSLKISYWFCLTSFLGEDGRRSAGSPFLFIHTRKILSVVIIGDLVVLCPDFIACFVIAVSLW